MCVKFQAATLIFQEMWALMRKYQYDWQTKNTHDFDKIFDAHTHVTKVLPCESTCIIYMFHIGLSHIQQCVIIAFCIIFD